jgi:ribosomal protein S18 acetylase RimI-like enzyme
VEQILHNPVYHGLISGDQHLSLGSENVKYFDEAVSPFVGFDEGYKQGFDELYDLLPAGRNILYAIPQPIATPKGWKLLHEIKGVQMVYEGVGDVLPIAFTPVPLDPRYAAEMVELARLTKPGPFAMRTIEFGHYYGIFEQDKLVAMTGQRLHPQPYTEVSAVCTHPDHLGKGYAFALVQHQVQLILQQGNLPFLHVREDNARAIALYERLGFDISRNMNFYFMRRMSQQCHP